MKSQRDENRDARWFTLEEQSTQSCCLQLRVGKQVQTRKVGWIKGKVGIIITVMSKGMGVRKGDSGSEWEVEVLGEDSYKKKKKKGSMCVCMHVCDVQPSSISLKV